MAWLELSRFGMDGVISAGICMTTPAALSQLPLVPRESAVHGFDNPVNERIAA